MNESCLGSIRGPWEEEGISGNTILVNYFVVFVLVLVLVLWDRSKFQFNSIQFNSIQFNSIQFNSIQSSAMQYNPTQFAPRLMWWCGTWTWLDLMIEWIGSIFGSLSWAELSWVWSLSWADDDDENQKATVPELSVSNDFVALRCVDFYFYFGFQFHSCYHHHEINHHSYSYSYYP